MVIFNRFLVCQNKYKRAKMNAYKKEDTQKKAIVFTEFGPPEVLQLREVEKPSPKKSEVLIKIYAAAVAKEDPKMRASPVLMVLGSQKSLLLEVI